MNKNLLYVMHSCLLRRSIKYNYNQIPENLLSLKIEKPSNTQITNDFRELRSHFSHPLFIDYVPNYNELREQGYPKKILFQKLNSFLSLPIYLFLMVFLASIFTLGSLVKSQNLYYIFIAIFTCVIIFFLKNLSFSLGETNKVSDILAIWIPILLISLFCLIGIIQINEK